LTSVSVELLSLSYRHGRQELIVGGERAVTDDRGEYRIVQGVVRDEDGIAVAGRVVLVPNVLERGPAAVYPSTLTDDVGRYRLDRVRPGRYQAVAIRDTTTPNPLQGNFFYQDPAFLERLLPNSLSVTVDEGSQNEVELEVRP
jgi:hypothetical protein